MRKPGKRWVCGHCVSDVVDLGVRHQSAVRGCLGRCEIGMGPGFDSHLDKLRANLINESKGKYN